MPHKVYMANNPEIKQNIKIAPVAKAITASPATQPKNDLVNKLLAAVSLQQRTATKKNTNQISTNQVVNLSSSRLTASRPILNRRAKNRSQTSEFNYYKDAIDASLADKLVTFLANLIKALDRLLFGSSQKSTEVEQTIIVPAPQVTRSMDEEEEEEFTSIYDELHKKEKKISNK
jgi:hypothetical protein